MQAKKQRCVDLKRKVLTKVSTRKIIICITIVLFFLFCGCQNKKNSTVSVPDVMGNFEFTILKTGKSDATVLKTENHCIIIDCGEKDDGDKIVEYLAENKISNVDYIFITHFDKDHVGGFPKVVESITADNIIVSDYKGHNNEYKKYIKSVEDNKLAVTSLKEDISFVLDDVLFEVSKPKKKSYNGGDNDFSLVISITHGKNTFLFAGDAEKERITEILSECNHEYDFLKVPHHGRYNENTKKFIDVVRPKYSAICDSKKNPAEDETLYALESAGSKIYRTQDGDINVSSNGRTIKIIQ